MKRTTSRNEKLRQVRALRKQRATLKRALASVDAKLRKQQKNSTTATSARSVRRPAAKPPWKRTTPRKKRSNEREDLKANRLEIASLEIQAAIGLRQTSAPAMATSDTALPLKARIHEALRVAGPAGLSLQELAAQLGVNYKHVAAWFATTGRKIPSIQKVGLNTYRYILV